MASVTRRPNGQWRGRYRDPAGREHARHFARKIDAEAWLGQVNAAMHTGTYVDPATARLTVADWADRWLAGYASRRPSTVRQARVHLARIVAEFGPLRLAEVRPSAVRSWTARLLGDGLAPSYVYALHARLAQLLGDAVHDGLIPRNPCSRRTSPGTAPQRPYVASTAQVWALHDTFPAHLRPAVLLGAFAGLRVGEVCGLRVADVDFLRGTITPAVQYPAEPLKTAASRTPVPIPRSLVEELAVGADSRTWVVEDPAGGQVGPWTVERAVRASRAAAGLPDGFRFHDLRHHFASALIAAGVDVKTVSVRLRHASPTVTLRVYAHLMPDADETTRAAVERMIASRPVQDHADSLRTSRSSVARLPRSGARGG